MAYNYNGMYNPYTANYPQNYSQNYTQPTIQHGGFVNVQSEKEAMEYPIANGTSLTFIDGVHMKLYVKTKGFSSLDQPIFKKYNIVEVAESKNTPEQEQTSNSIEYAEKGEIEAIKDEIQHIKDDIKKLSEVKTDE